MFVFFSVSFASTFTVCFYFYVLSLILAPCSCFTLSFTYFFYACGMVLWMQRGGKPDLNFLWCGTIKWTLNLDLRAVGEKLDVCFLDRIDILLYIPSFYFVRCDFICLTAKYRPTKQIKTFCASISPVIKRLPVERWPTFRWRHRRLRLNSMNCFTHTQLWCSDPTLWSAVTLRFPAITSSPPTPISKSTPRHLRHCHLLIITRSAARGLLSDMAARRAFHLNSHTHVFQPQPITHFDTHIGMCAHTNPHVHGGGGKKQNTPIQKHWAPSAPGRGDPTVRFISPLLSLLAAGTITLTQTPYFCHRPQDSEFPSYLSFFCGRSGNGDGGLKGSGTWVSCGKPECSLWPHSMRPSPSPPAPPVFLYLRFSFGRES